MKKTWKRLCTGFLALATVVTALPTTPVHAESKQYWTESKERVGIVEKVMNDGSIGSTFNEGHLTVEGEDAYCIDINTDFKNGYKTRADASSRMSADQISDVALSIEYVKQYTDSHSGISKNHAYLLRQLVVWQRLSVHLGWQCDNVRASYDEIPKATQDEVFAGAKAFVKENKGRYECGGYIYSGEGQELGQFWAKLNVGNAKLQKTSSNTSITDGNGNYSIAGATYGVFADKNCTKQLATLTTDENGNTDVAEVKACTVYIKELSAPAGYKVDKTIYPLTIKADETATLKVSDTPKVTDTLIELFKIDMETQKDNPQGNASLAGAEFTWKYYAGFYNKGNLPAEATRTWVTKTIAETDSDGTTHYITKLADAYKVSGDSFYMQDSKAVLPLGTLTVEETKAPNGYLLDGAYMQAGDKSEQIKGLYVTQITEDGDLAVLSGSNQFSVSDKVIRGGVKIQKRDLETGDTKPQGSATLKDTAFDIISLNDNAVLVEGKLYKKNEVVKTIRTDKLSDVLEDDTEQKVILTPEQEERLLAFMEKDKIYSKYYDEVVLLLETGLRISEFCGLTTHIDMQNKILNIDHQLLKDSEIGYYIETPKTKNGKRELPLTERAYQAIQRILKNRGKAQPLIVGGYSNFLFLNREGLPKVAGNYEGMVRGLIKKYNKYHTDKLPNITPHSFRHTYCTNMANRGMNPNTLQYLMGHANITMTLGYYAHGTFQSAKAELERLAC